MEQIHQLLRVRHRQRFEQHCIHHAEDGRIRAYAQRQREHTDNCESGGFSQMSNAVPQMTQEVRHAIASTGELATSGPLSSVAISLKLKVEGITLTGERCPQPGGRVQFRTVWRTKTAISPGPDARDCVVA